LGRICWGLTIGLMLVVPDVAVGARLDARATYLKVAQPEALSAGLPLDLVDAVMAIESSFDPSRIGGVGEIGLMQVRPATARMLGFAGTPEELADPAVNLRFGIRYLAGAWRLAGGDLCRTLMKYRAGHREEVMTSRSSEYCRRARAHLASIGSTLGGSEPGEIRFQPLLSAPARPGSGKTSTPAKPSIRLRGKAFWAAHEARIRAINASIQRRWRQRS